jgi:hypothetical protein
LLIKGLLLFRLDKLYCLSGTSEPKCLSLFSLEEL